MTHDEHAAPDFGAGQKKLSIYLLGVIICLLLTFLSFALVKTMALSKIQTIVILYFSAIVQFIVQLLCFLRMNTQTPQAQVNVLSFLFTLIILTSIVAGSLWIMVNLNYNMT